jgi:hypothetical protein
MVSCVPGSPIDWAAMTPTASPALTIAATKVTAITLGTQTVAGIAGQRRANLDFVDAQLSIRSTKILVEHGAGKR